MKFDELAFNPSWFADPPPWPIFRNLGEEVEREAYKIMLNAQAQIYQIRATALQNIASLPALRGPAGGQVAGKGGV